MAIDAALGRLGNKSGVCTSSTRPTNPFEGQLIYETDTNRTLVYDNAAWVVIANASATNFPTSLDTNTVDSIAALQAKVGVDGSAVTSSLDYKVTQQGLTFIKSQAIGSGVSSVTVTDAFSATFDHYRVITQINTSSSSPYIGMTIGSSTGGYYGGRAACTYAGAFSGAGDNAAGKFSYLAAGYLGSPIQFSADIRAPFLATETQIFSSYVDSNATSGASAGTYSGFLNNSTSHSYFTIAPSTGTITGGTIRVYGYNNG